ncbi:hypothetical protein HY414_01080 [Candidatus Kaiserbacteria bacterium]|nr:hypothetical protein [Candidatus Kaiserbacteria bacterium]
MKSPRSIEINAFLSALATRGYQGVSVEGGPLSHWKQADAEGLSRLLEREAGWIFQVEGSAAALQICSERWIPTIARDLGHPEVMVGNRLYEVRAIRKGPEGILIRLAAQNGQEGDYTLEELGLILWPEGAPLHERPSPSYS